MTSKTEGGYVQVNAVDWQPFPAALSTGGIRWKLLHVSPEMGAWTAIFDCPQGSGFASHIHIGPGEYLLTKGKMEVRGGDEEGGATAYELGYGYEACHARHDKTYFPEDSEFFMLGREVFIQMLTQSPGLLSEILSDISGKIRASNEKVYHEILEQQKKLACKLKFKC
mgnify:CR=1 FL=1